MDKLLEKHQSQDPLAVLTVLADTFDKLAKVKVTSPVTSDGTKVYCRSHVLPRRLVGQDEEALLVCLEAMEPMFTKVCPLLLASSVANLKPKSLFPNCIQIYRDKEEEKDYLLIFHEEQPILNSIDLGRIATNIRALRDALFAGTIEDLRQVNTRQGAVWKNKRVTPPIMPGEPLRPFLAKPLTIPADFTEDEIRKVMDVLTYHYGVTMLIDAQRPKSLLMYGGQLQRVQRFELGIEKGVQAR